MNIQNISKQVQAIAKYAGQLMCERNDISIEDKGDVANLVTSKDVEVQNYIIQELQSIMPEAKVIAEENGEFAFDNGYVWIIDPIDGTTNYAYDMKFSAISIALVYQNTGVLGVVYNPYLEEMFVGIKGEGSTLNEKKMQVKNNDFSHSLVIFGTSPYKKELAPKTFANAQCFFENARDVRRSGSAVLDLCYVACGRVDAYYEESLAPWDYAAASTILLEAQGTIEIIGNKEWKFDQTLGMIAGNKNNLKMLKKLMK